MNIREIARLIAGSLVVYAIVASCGSEPVPDAYASTSGTRLKAKFRLGSDGAKEFLPSEWWDSTRREYCFFSGYPMSDGTTRCIPTLAANATTSGYYADSACTKPLALVTPLACGAESPKYLYTVSWGSGCYVMTVYAIQSAYTGTVYSGSSANCYAVTTLPASYAFYYVGAEIAPSEFASATVDHE